MGRKLRIVQDITEGGAYRAKMRDEFVQIYKKPGVSGKRIKTDNAFTNTRLHNNEFKECALAGKIIREQLAPLLSDTKDKGLVGRVLKLTHSIQNTDDTPRGYKSFAGMAEKEASLLLAGFNFLTGKGLDALIFKQPSITRDGICFKDFVALTDFLIPGGATHVELRGGCIYIDFAGGVASSTYSKPVRVPLNDRVREIKLKATMDSFTKGVGIFVLKLNFYQKTFKMGTKDTSALQIIKVVCVSDQKNVNAV
ncbi:MAG: hypothetical protein V4565_03735 [Bacteroidota bacterium]